MNSYSICLPEEMDYRAHHDAKPAMIVADDSKCWRFCPDRFDNIGAITTFRTTGLGRGDGVR